MSRSYRHTPIIAITSSGYHGSEKQDKALWHRQVRSQFRDILTPVRSLEEALDIPFFPHKNDVQVYSWTKDGKQELSPTTDTAMYWTKEGHLRK